MFDRLSEDQRQVLNIVREGHNVFITGQGGMGKSFFGYVNILRADEIGKAQGDHLFKWNRRNHIVMGMHPLSTRSAD